MNFLALTTPLVDLVDLLRRLRCPLLLIDLMTLIYRYVFVLLESLDQMYTAQSSRLGYVNFRRGITSAGLLGSQLFIDAYRRSQRLQVALESRGYSGELKVLPTTYQYDRRLWGWGTGMIVSLLLVWGWF
jgi:cobalt/nickel transport system permease protein